jgi:hypothetical protein
MKPGVSDINEKFFSSKTVGLITKPESLVDSEPLKKWKTIRTGLLGCLIELFVFAAEPWKHR